MTVIILNNGIFLNICIEKIHLKVIMHALSSIVNCSALQFIKIALYSISHPLSEQLGLACKYISDPYTCLAVDLPHTIAQWCLRQTEKRCLYQNWDPMLKKKRFSSRAQ